MVPPQSPTPQHLTVGVQGDGQPRSGHPDRSTRDRSRSTVRRPLASSEQRQQQRQTRSTNTVLVRPYLAFDHLVRDGEFYTHDFNSKHAPYLLDAPRCQRDAPTYW